MDRPQSRRRLQGFWSLLIGQAQKPNRWKGFFLGMIAGQAALIAMTVYQVKVAPALAGEAFHQRRSAGRQGSGSKASLRGQDGNEEGNAGGENNRAGNQDHQGEHGPFDSISLVGKHYKEGESSTAALGREIDRQLTGKEPSARETQELLSYLVHWVYGPLMGGVYGALRGGVRFLDMVGGLTYATGLWLFGDELAVPILGLQAGPTASSLVQHFNRLAAHLLYGAVVSVTTQGLFLAQDDAMATGRQSRP